MKNIKLSIISILMFLISINIAFSQTDRPGIECGCNTFEDYVKPAVSEILVPELITVKDGQSKNGTYQLEAVKVSNTHTNITIRNQGKIILNSQFRAGGWGFSPDEHRFVIHGVDQNNWHWYHLYNLNPDPTVEQEDAVQLFAVAPTDFSSANISFSPHGHYMLHAAIGNNLGNLVLNIYDARSGSVVYNVNTINICGSPAGKSVGGWGFSPDVNDATFIHAFLTDPSHYALFVKNLSSGTGEFVLSAPSNTGGAYWRFSPCGDYFAWIFDYGGENIACSYYKTNETNVTPDETGSGIGFKKFYTKADGHYIKYFNGSVKIFDNTSDGGCSDGTAPTWSGATLTASDIKGTELTLSWSGASDNVGVVGYRVYQDGSLIKELGDYTTYTVNGLDESTSYTFKIEAGDATENWSTGGPEDDFPTVADNDPTWTGSETLDTVYVKGTSVKLKWDRADDDYGVTGYKVYVEGSEYKTVEDTNVIITGLIPSTEYTFKIEAADAAGQWTSDGPDTTHTTKSDNSPVWPPGAEITDTEITENTIDFSWTKAVDDWDQLNKYYIIIDKILTDSLPYYDTTYYIEELEEGTPYEIGIVAKDVAGNESDTLFESISTLAGFVVEPLIVNDSLQRHPDIFDNLVVWEDHRNGNADIYMYDLETDVTTQITSNTADQVKPRINGQMITWTDYRNGNSDIYFYDLFYDTEVPVCTLATSQTEPEVWQPYIVWEDSRNGNQDIYMWDRESLSEAPVCTNGDDQFVPSISDNRVVWEDFRHGNSDVYMYEIYKDEETRLTTQSNSQVQPSISGRNVVWHEHRTTTDDIYRKYLYAISDYHWEFVVNADGEFAGTTDQQWAHVNDDQIVFQDERDGNWDIYAFQLTNYAQGEFKTVCAESGDQTRPRTSKKRVVWQDTRNDDGDIYIWDRPPGIDIQTAITDNEDPVSIGDSISYTITVFNDGPDDASNLIINCLASSEITFSSAQGDIDSVKQLGEKIIIYKNVLLTDSTITIIANYYTYSKATVSVNIEATADGFDPDQTNNICSETTNITPLVKELVDEGVYAEMIVEDNGMVHLAYVKDDTLIYASKIPDGKWKYKQVGYVGPLSCADMELDTGSTFCYAFGVYDYDTLWHSITSLHYMEFDTGANILTTELIMESDSGFYSTDVEIDHQGNKHLVVHYADFSNVSTGQIFYFKKESGSNFDTIPQRIYPSMYNSLDLEIDSEDNLHLTFYDISRGGTNPVYMNTIGNPQGVWNTPESAETDWKGGQMEGIHISLDLDSADNPQIFYVGSVDNFSGEDHKFAKKINGTWHISLVDEGVFQSAESTMSKDLHENIHAFYYSHKHGQLRYATNRMGNWVKQMITEAGWAWRYSMHVCTDQWNYVHFSYLLEDSICYAVMPALDLITLSDDTLDYDIVDVGNASSMKLIITNPSDVDISIDSLVVESSDEYSFSKNSFILAPGASDSVTITLTPVDRGIKDAILNIYFGGASMLITDVILIGRTSMPVIEVSSDHLAFGAVEMLTSDTLSVTVKNTGEEDLEITSLEIRYSDFIIGTNDFQIASNTSTTVSSGDSCEIEIKYTPDHIEDQSTYLNIYSNDPINERVKVRLTGHAPRPLVYYSAPTFESPIEPDSSITETLYLMNGGDGDLVISSMAMTWTNASEFPFTYSCDIVPPGDTCYIDVTFAPTYVGSKHARLYIYSNYEYSPSIVFLYGSCVSRSYEITDTILDFGEVNTLLDSVSSVWIKNTGTGSVEIEDISVTGANSDDFEFSHDCDEISEGDSCEIFISFSPVAAGSKSATLTITTNVADNPITDIALTGIGVESGEPLVVEISVDESVGDAPMECNFTSVVTGDVGMLAFNWIFGDSETSTAPNPTHTYNNTGNYTVVLTVTEGVSRTARDTLYISVLEPGSLFNITGNVFYGDTENKLEVATVELYVEDEFSASKTVTLIDTNLYTISNLESGIYTIKVNPDEASYPDGYSTYYGDVLFMAEATYINLVSDTTEIDIIIQIPQSAGTGNGEISGTLVEDETVGGGNMLMKSSKADGVPIGHTSVFLLESGSKDLLYALETDIAGEFDFSNLPLNDYIFAADYNGTAIDYDNCLISVTEDTNHVTITAIIASGLLTVEKKQIIVIKDINGNHFKVFPNPVNERFYIQMAEDTKPEKTRIYIVDGMGRYLHFNMIYVDNNIYEIDVSDLISGMYMINIFNEGITWKGMLIKK